MSSVKAEVDIEKASKMLAEIMEGPVTDVAPIDMGELSKVYRFTHQNEHYVVHFRNNRETFDKAKFIYEQYYSPETPMPKVVKIGQIEQIYYAISERISGEPVNQLPLDTIKKLLPSIIDVFTAMNRVPITETGYGRFTSSGQVMAPNWLEYFKSFYDPNMTGFYAGWYDLFETSFLEKDFFYTVYDKIVELSVHVPEQRYLVHGDFHLGNLLSDGERITGVVDWEMGTYGDFMFDVAVLDYWTPQANFAQTLRETWEQHGRTIPHFEERLLSFKLFNGLDALRFYAQIKRRENYDFSRKVLADLLGL